MQARRPHSRRRLASITEVPWIARDGTGAVAVCEPCCQKIRFSLLIVFYVDGDTQFMTRSAWHRNRAATMQLSIEPRLFFVRASGRGDIDSDPMPSCFALGVLKRGHRLRRQRARSCDFMSFASVVSIVGRVGMSIVWVLGLLIARAIVIIVGILPVVLPTRIIIVGILPVVLPTRIIIVGILPVVLPTRIIIVGILPVVLPTSIIIVGILAAIIVIATTPILVSDGGEFYISYAVATYQPHLQVGTLALVVEVLDHLNKISLLGWIALQLEQVLLEPCHRPICTAVIEFIGNQRCLSDQRVLLSIRRG